MDDANIGAVPSDSLGTAGTTSSKPGALGYLNGEWVNARVMNVADKATAILERIIDQGLLAGEFAPFESPITDDMLMKMRPEQFAALYQTLTSEEERAALLAKMKDLKMPINLEMPKLPPTPATLTKFEKLAPSPLDSVRSGTSV
jgi:hypothetical protein